jgi:uncharacterized protein (TIGR02646 family)
MRPVERGTPPDDGNGVAKVFTEYADARADLFARLGRYCSFCERPIKAGLSVEHVLPKSLPQFSHLEREWTNFLLACVNCNSTKGAKPRGRKGQFLPDRDNTYQAIVYSVGGQVSANAILSPSEKRKASKLIRMVGLDKIPTNDPQAKDLRWNDRREAWDKATRYRGKYEAGMIGADDIIELCRADGHWSIWMTVFVNIAAIGLALIAALPGTADCFDDQGNAVRRQGGQI